MFVGDIHGQISATLEKVEALMAQAGAGLKDITAATIFVKRPEYVDIQGDGTGPRTGRISGCMCCC